jgi:hypothetical protein
MIPSGGLLVGAVHPGSLVSFDGAAVAPLLFGAVLWAILIVVRRRANHPGPPAPDSPAVARAARGGFSAPA